MGYLIIGERMVLILHQAVKSIPAVPHPSPSNKGPPDCAGTQVVVDGEMLGIFTPPH